MLTVASDKTRRFFTGSKVDSTRRINEYFAVGVGCRLRGCSRSRISITELEYYGRIFSQPANQALKNKKFQQSIEL